MDQKQVQEVSTAFYKNKRSPFGNLLIFKTRVLPIT